MENASKTHWREVPLPPLEGEVPNGREAEGFVHLNCTHENGHEEVSKLSKKTPQLRCAQQLPFQGSQGGFAAGGAKNIRAAFRLAFCQSHQFQQGGADLLFLHHKL